MIELPFEILSELLANFHALSEQRNIEKADVEKLLVKFKDYGYFMPKNIVGKDVVLEGEATIKEVSVKQQQHYAKDAGKSEKEIKKITKAKQEVRPPFTFLDGLIALLFVPIAIGTNNKAIKPCLLADIFIVQYVYVPVLAETISKTPKRTYRRLEHL